MDPAGLASTAPTFGTKLAEGLAQTRAGISGAITSAMEVMVVGAVGLGMDWFQAIWT